MEKFEEKVIKPEALVEQFEVKVDQLISSINETKNDGEELLEQLRQSVETNADSGVGADEIVKRGKELVQLQTRVTNKIKELSEN